ncbi:hypothetical protein [Micromonospora narathiwatensis]|uniref:Uncharacterized protein n=1 Tax=Micromonospora narathiwatensis TaxID=299146 RepID=A0A1A9ADF0_9ACTN|nr:hypothetical protein [Micromonospora narathiwatensis]SBT54217.1 hypothetical protein GA0070621_5255 [Micromonospora narathiwatensis]
MSWEVSQNVSKDPDRVDQRFNVPMPVNPGMPFVGDVRGVSFDRVGVEQAHTPSQLVAGEGEQGVQTEWDAGSLDSAKTWLEAHAEYVYRLSYSMSAIKDELGGDQAAAGSGSLGGFANAKQLATEHLKLYGSTEQGLRSLSESLYAAADALGEVKRKYEDAEHANSMTAQEMQQAFNNAARGGGEKD